MSTPPEFPHLPLIFQGPHRARLTGGGEMDPRVRENRENRHAHAERLRSRFSSIRDEWRREQEQRRQAGLPTIGDKTVFALQLPELHDLTYLTRTFGLELVAEYEDGYVLAGAPDLDLGKLYQALRLFEAKTWGGSSCANLLEVFGPNDQQRLEKILSPTLLRSWPFNDAETLTLDIWVEVPGNPGFIQRQRTRKRERETEADFESRRQALLQNTREQQQQAWDEARDGRVEQLEGFIRGNGGRIVDQAEDPGEEDGGIVLFPDSVLVRVSMSGRGFRDIVLNFPYVVLLCEPDEADQPAVHEAAPEAADDFQLAAPEGNAPAVCIVDSGIQEGHRWLAAAVDTASSRCFVPGRRSDEVADECRPVGHGTLVAGAVLYPDSVPKTGKVQAGTWIQNARVLDGNGKFLVGQNNLLELQRIVARYRAGNRNTRLFVHSINDTRPCHRRRMTAWGALIDALSHKYDVLFFQSAGNLSLGAGNQPNPGVQGHLAAARNYPDFLLEESSRVAAPGQSLHALTVGSVAAAEWIDGNRRSFAPAAHYPSAFSRTGLGLWDSVKPDVVEIGGDFARDDTGRVLPCPATAPELVQSTLYGAPAIGRSQVGTSFAAPKVAHIAAHLESLFPGAPTLLYRALIVNSARWPGWAEGVPAAQHISVLRQLGFGLPDLSRASENTPRRVTLITAEAHQIRNQQAFVFRVPVPPQIRNPEHHGRVRIDVTLCYTSLSRPTRSTKNGYLETWLSWKASHVEEPLDSFIRRATVQAEKADYYPGLPWMLHQREDRGLIEGASRDNGTAQKDWAIIENTRLPDDFAIAVQAHKGWNQEDGGGLASFALVVSFEALDGDIGVYASIENAIRVEAEASARAQAAVQVRA